MDFPTLHRTFDLARIESYSLTLKLVSETEIYASIWNFVMNEYYSSVYFITKTALREGLISALWEEIEQALKVLDETKVEIVENTVVFTLILGNSFKNTPMLFELEKRNLKSVTHMEVIKDNLEFEINNGLRKETDKLAELQRQKHIFSSLESTQILQYSTAVKYYAQIREILSEEDSAEDKESKEKAIINIFDRLLFAEDKPGTNLDSIFQYNNPISYEDAATLAGVANMPHLSSQKTVEVCF